MRKQCAEGYHGPLCAMCIREGPEPYGRTSTWSCQRCKSPVAIVLAFIGSNLLSLGSLYYSIHSTLKDNEDDVANTGYGNKVKASELTRVGYLGFPISCLAACTVLQCCANSVPLILSLTLGCLCSGAPVMTPNGIDFSFLSFSASTTQPAA